MFRLDDIDLDFGDMDEAPVGAAKMSEKDGALSLGFTSSPSDIFCESPPPKMPRRSSEVLQEPPGTLQHPPGSPLRAEAFPESPQSPLFQEPLPQLRTPAAASTQRDFSPVARPAPSPRTPLFAVAPPRREEGRRSARKLPGPAGALPKLKPNQDLNKLSLPSKPRTPTPSQKSSGSQPNSQEEEPWSAARTAIGPLLWPTFEKYNIARVTAQASRRQLSARCKVPCMCLQLEEMVVESVDARVRLKDGSGAMNGTLHREALRSFKDLLRIGSVILLKLVSVFSPTPKTHYLNITRTNLLHVFGDGSPPPPPVTLDLIRQWEAQCCSPPALPQRGFVRRPAQTPPTPTHRPEFNRGPAQIPPHLPHRPGLNHGPVQTPPRLSHRPEFAGRPVQTPPQRPGLNHRPVQTHHPSQGPSFAGRPVQTPPRFAQPPIAQLPLNHTPVQSPLVTPNSSVQKCDPDLSSMLDDGMDELLASSMCDEMLSDW